MWPNKTCGYKFETVRLKNSHYHKMVQILGNEIQVLFAKAHGWFSSRLVLQPLAAVQFSFTFKCPQHSALPTVKAQHNKVLGLCLYTTWAGVVLGDSDSSWSLSFQSQHSLNSLTSEPQFQIPGTEDSTGSSWVRLAERYSGVLRECFLTKWC